jgi:hypothetical protein
MEAGRVCGWRSGSWARMSGMKLVKQLLTIPFTWLVVISVFGCWLSTAPQNVKDSSAFTRCEIVLIFVAILVVIWFAIWMVTLAIELLRGSKKDYPVRKAAGVPVALLGLLGSFVGVLILLGAVSSFSRR